MKTNPVIQTKEKIRIENVSKSFTKKNGKQVEMVQALQDVSFSVGESEFVTVVGPSGCGKTTLLKIIGGLINQDKGRVNINGQPIDGPGPDRGIVFQNFGLMPWKNVLHNIMFALELRKPEEKKTHKETALKFIEMTGLSGFENHYPHELSGGMQQRVGVARALAVDPEILLMDEPFGAIDAQTREILQEELLKLWQKNKKTVIFITHSIDEAVYLSDKILVLDAHPGRVKAVLENDLPRPRWNYPVRKEKRYGELREQVWEMIKHSAKQSQGVK